MVADASHNVEGGGSMRPKRPSGVSVVGVVGLTSASLLVDVSATSLSACLLYVWSAAGIDAAVSSVVGCVDAGSG